MSSDKEQIISMTCLQLFGKPKIPRWKQLNPFTAYPQSLDLVFEVQRNYKKTFVDGGCRTCKPKKG
jgi:hypothetical protein